MDFVGWPEPGLRGSDVFKVFTLQYKVKDSIGPKMFKVERNYFSLVCWTICSSRLM
jgi:hypothetical protein